MGDQYWNVALVESGKIEYMGIDMPLLEYEKLIPIFAFDQRQELILVGLYNPA